MLLFVELHFQLTDVDKWDLLNVLHELEGLSEVLLFLDLHPRVLGVPTFGRIAQQLAWDTPHSIHTRVKAEHPTVCAYLSIFLVGASTSSSLTSVMPSAN